MAGRRECKDARTVRAIEDRVDDVMNMWRRLNMFYEHIVHEPELRELDMSLALECLAGLARRRSKAYNRRAGLENISAMLCMEDATMPRAKQASKRKRGTKAVPALGAAGLTFSLMGGASAAAVPTQDVPQVPNVAPSHEVMLGEEEISDVSLATFFVFDKENRGSLRRLVQQAPRPRCVASP